MYSVSNPRIIRANTTNEQASTDAETTATENGIIGGSRHSIIDCNTRLKVPQYRTQSDNLLIPKASCNVTTMAIVLERLANNRENVIESVETKLKEGKHSPHF